MGLCRTCAHHEQPDTRVRPTDPSDRDGTIRYHMVMTRKQTLVQLSDELVRRLDAKALELDRSRSALIREAIEQYLKDDWDEEIARQYREAYTRLPQTEEELTWSDVAAKETLRRLDQEEDEPW